MFGSVADAEDIVHEAFIRWMKADRITKVRRAEAFLRHATVRLYLDRSNPREIGAGPYIDASLSW